MWYTVECLKHNTSFFDTMMYWLTIKSSLSALFISESGYLDEVFFSGLKLGCYLFIQLHDTGLGRQTMVMLYNCLPECSLIDWYGASLLQGVQWCVLWLSSMTCWKTTCCLQQTGERLVLMAALQSSLNRVRTSSTPLSKSRNQNVSIVKTNLINTVAKQLHACKLVLYNSRVLCVE